MVLLAVCEPLFIVVSWNSKVYNKIYKDLPQVRHRSKDLAGDNSVAITMGCCPLVIVENRKLMIGSVRMGLVVVGPS